MPIKWLAEKLKFPTKEVGIISRAIKSKFEKPSEEKKDSFEIEKEIPNRKSQETSDYLKNYLSLKAKKITGGITSAIGEAQITKDITTLGRSLPPIRTPFEAIRGMTESVKEDLRTFEKIPPPKIPFEIVKDYLKPKPPTDLPALDFYDKLQDIKKRPEQLVPFVASGAEAVKFSELLLAANRLKEDNASREDIFLLQEYVDHNSKDTSYGYKVLDVVSMMPSFMGELLLTSGIATAGRTAITKGAKETLKSLLTKKGKDLLKTRAGKFGLKVTAEIGARTLQAPVAGATRIASGTLERQLQGTLGELVEEEKKEDLWLSATKSFGEQWVETLSEFSGGLFKPLSKPIKNKLLKVSLFGAFQKANPMAKLDDLAAVVGKLGYHGVLSEMLEERMADVGHGVLHELGLGDQEFSLPSGEQLAVEFAAFSVPGVAFTAVNQLDPTLDKVREYLKKIKPGLTIEAVEEEAPTENYNEWLRKQPEALKRIKEYDENAKTITNEKDKIKYLENAKHEFDTEFSKKFAERVETTPTDENARAFQMYSPNVGESMSFSDAIKKLSSSEQARFRSVAIDINKNSGLTFSETRNVIGDTKDYGKENAMFDIATVSSAEEIALSRIAAAKKGLEGSQLSTLHFVEDVKGKDNFYIVSHNIDNIELRKILDKNGIEFRTIDKGKFLVYDENKVILNNINNVTKQIDGQLEIVAGKGEFIGGETRAEGLQSYKRVIEEGQVLYDSRVPKAKIKPAITEKVSEAGFVVSEAPSTKLLTEKEVRLVKHINEKDWWRTAESIEGKKERGQFLASSFEEAEFYGRPIDTPFNVEVKNPLIGDEKTIMRKLDMQKPSEDISIKERFALDKEMAQRTKKQDYDSIVLMSPSGYVEFIDSGKIPKSIELNDLSPLTKVQEKAKEIKPKVVIPKAPVSKAVAIDTAIKAIEGKIPVTKMTKAIREFIGEKPSPLVTVRKRKATVIKERIVEMQKEAKRKISEKGKIARTIDEMIIEKEKAVRKAELEGGKNVIIQRFKALNKGLRKGRSLTRKEIEATQTEVIDLLDASMLEKNDKAKFIRAIKNIQTTEQLRKALPVIQERIETLVEKASKRVLKAKIKKELENTKIRKQAGKPVGKFTPEIQKNLNLLREASRLTKKEAESRIQESLEKYNRGDIPEDVALENKILNMIAGMDEMSSNELNDILNQIQTIKDTGKLTVELKKFNRQADINMWVNEAIDVITGGKGIPENISTVGVKELSSETLREKAQKFIGALGKDFVGWDDIIDMLARKTKAKPGTTWLDTFSDTTTQENAVKKGWRINLLGKGKARKMADEAFKFKGDRDMVKRFQDDVIEVSLGIFKNAEGRMSEIIYTKSEARKAWMELQDPTLEETFKTGMDYTNEIVEAIDNFLTKEDKAFANKQLDFYREYYNGVNNIYRDLYGTDLPKNEFYSPIKREGIMRDESIGFGEFLQEIPIRESITSGSLKARIKNIKPLKKQSDISALEQHVAEMEHFKAWAFKIRDFKAVFGDPMVRASIIREHGKDMLGMVDNFVNDFTRGGEELASRLNWLDKLRGNFSRAVLAMKASIGVKQLTSFIAYADTIPSKDFGIGFADFWSNPLEKIKILGESEMMKARGKHMERDIKTVISSDAYASFRKKPNFLNSLMLNIQIGDQGAIYVGGWSVYKYHRKQGKSHEEALRIFEKVTSNTQQSADLSKQSYWQRGGSFAKLFTMFKSAPNQFFRKELGALRNLAHGRITTQQFAKTVAIYHVIIPMMFQFVSDWFKWDPEEQKRAVITGPFNGIFIIGDGFAYLVRGALDLRQFPSEIPLYSIPRDFDKVTKLISDDDITTEDVFRAIRGLAGAVGAVKGYPLKQSIDITTGIKEVLGSEYETGLAKFLGWSPYIAEKSEKKGTTLKLPTRSLPTR